MHNKKKIDLIGDICGNPNFMLIVDAMKEPSDIF